MASESDPRSMSGDATRRNDDGTPDAGGGRSYGDLSTKRAEAQRERFRVGDVLLGRYKITGELGQGGMGVVFRCFDEVGGIDVAVKVLPPELSHNTVEMDEVRENFRTVHGLHHPNIAATTGLEQDPDSGEYYLIMECVEGMNLRRWRRQHITSSHASGHPGGPSPGGGRRESGHETGERGRGSAPRAHPEVELGDIVPILRQAALALDYAHGERIIHRDIKPSNIMVTPDGKVKVLDFGLAAQIHTSLTRVSQVQYGTSGTAPYMAPEQWEGVNQGAPTDQYALAVTAYELLCGHLPFEGADPMVLRGAVLNAPPRPIPGLGKRA